MRYFKKFEKFILENRIKRDVSDFTQEERNLIDDLLLEIANKYNMIEMPKSEDGHFFDTEIGKTQYLVQRLKNIGIDIESTVSSLEVEFLDIKQNFITRLEKYGYHIYHCELERYNNRNCISITVMKKD